MILRMVGNKADADDLTADTFAKAYINIQQCEPHLSFRTWLYSIAYNNAIDHLRKKKVETIPLNPPATYRKSGEKELQNKLGVNTDNPEEVYIKKQNARLLHQALSTLKPKYRKLLELRYLKEYSFYEISEELKIPPSTIRVQLFRSREKLFDLLKNAGISH